MGNRPTGSALLAGAMGICILLATPLAGGASDTPTRLHLRVGSFDPLIEQPLLSPTLRFDTEPDEGYFVAQLDRAIAPALLEELEESGARPVAYLPDRALVVHLSANRKPDLRRHGAVRWLGAVQPGWKLSPDLGSRPFEDPERRAGGRMFATIDLFPGTDPDAAAQLVRATGAEWLQTIVFADTLRLKVRATRDQLERAARIQAVAWIEEAAEIRSRNDTARWVTQTNLVGSTTIWDHGLHGEGQIIGHIDGELDIDSCYFEDPVDNTPGPGHRKVVGYRSSTGLGADGHGTHVAGTMAGDPSPFTGTLDQAGLAYAAKITHSRQDDITGFGSTTSNLYSYLSMAHADGARVHGNSWGDDGTTQYTTWSRDIDRFAYDHEDSLVVFAVTNGIRLRTPENAKNVLAVGASYNGTSADSHCSGGDGPTSDGRRKPELYAPGCGIVSARNGSACSTRSLSGTSMACPLITAAGAIVRQYFEEGRYPTGAPVPADARLPSGALVKAMLINAGVDMQFVADYPNNREGWGRLLLEDALYFAGDLRRLALLADARNAVGLQTGGEDSYVVQIDGNGEPLEATLVYTEPPAALLAASATVNDLDLELVSPSGLLYRGNVFDVVSGSSITGGGADPTNNVEQVLLPTPETGAWTVRVRGAAVNEGRQGYALLATGQLSAAVSGPVRYLAHTIADDPSGNGDAVADAGETLELPLSLLNLRVDTATAVSARLISADPARVKVTGDLASYPDIPEGDTADSLAPHYTMTVAPDVPCGASLPLELEVVHSAGSHTSPFQLPVGRDLVFVEDPNVPVTVPPTDPAPTDLKIPMFEAFTVADVQVAVEILHGDVGELTVQLRSPQGTLVVLHDRTLSGTADIVTVYDDGRPPDGPGSLDDIDGESSIGVWTLSIFDTVDDVPVVPGAVVESWSLKLLPETPLCSPIDCPGDPIPGAVGESLTVGVESGSALRFVWSGIPGASGYRVWRSGQPGFPRERLVGAVAATELLAQDALDDDPLTFYLVRAVNSCGWEGP